MITDDTIKKLEAMGIKMAAPDHPIYTGGSMVMFVNRSGDAAKQYAQEEPLDLQNLPFDPAVAFAEEIERKKTSPPEDEE
jgi:hypothetical protein